MGDDFRTGGIVGLCIGLLFGAGSTAKIISDNAPSKAYEIRINPYEHNYGNDLIIESQGGNKYFFLRQKDGSLKKLEELSDELRNKDYETKTRGGSE